MNPRERSSRVDHRLNLFHLLGSVGIPHSQLGAETSTCYATFSTWLNSNSTGVERPKIVTITFSVSRSSFTSSTIPWNVANGPSEILTVSFFSNLTLSLGFSRLL